MCKRCKTSPLGIQREGDLNAAIVECQRLNINPTIAGFIARHAYQGHVPQCTHEQRVAVDAYNRAVLAIKTLHVDYVFGLAREDAQRRLSERKAKKPDLLMQYFAALDHDDLDGINNVLTIAGQQEAYGDQTLINIIFLLHCQFAGINERQGTPYVDLLRAYRQSEKREDDGGILLS